MSRCESEEFFSGCINIRIAAKNVCAAATVQLRVLHQDGVRKAVVGKVFVVEIHLGFE